MEFSAQYTGIGRPALRYTILRTHLDSNEREDSAPSGPESGLPDAEGARPPRPRVVEDQADGLPGPGGGGPKERGGHDHHHHNAKRQAGTASNFDRYGVVNT